ncbi:MAG: VOC family protein, partial [Schleiferiaceae bacterium]|nr:VOC family protein [Schleiferiaceae bacterium]
FMVAVVVPDYDEAIAHYTQAWGFVLLEDSVRTPEKRWVRVAPPGSPCALLLAKATTPAQEAAIGQQAGGRVFLFMHCEDLDADVARLAEHGCYPEAPVRQEEFGKVCVVADRYGNRWDLIQPIS